MAQILCKFSTYCELEVINMIENKNRKKSTKMKDNEIVNENRPAVKFVDPNVNVRIVLASLWISHFLLWTFGDMVSLLQETTSPVSGDLLLFVAAPLAVIQMLMIVFSLTGKPRSVRLVNLCVTPVFLLFNLGYLFDYSEGYNYLLGTAYILVNVLIIRHAWKWPKVDDQPQRGIQ
jgi:hypothetical protein